MNSEIPDLMRPTNNQESNGNNSKKEKKEIKTGVGILVIAVVALVIIGAIYLLVFNKSDDKKEENNPTPTPTATPTATPSQVKDEELSVNDSEVQRLFSYIKNSEIQRQFEVANVSKFSAMQLTDEQKNYMGYLQVPVSEIKSEACSKYPGVIQYGSGTTSRPSQIVCGDDGSKITNIGYDDRNNITKVITKEVLRNYVEMIFGELSFKDRDFEISFQESYKMDSLTGNYVYTKCYACGGTGGPRGESSLISALKTANNIQIVEQITERISNGNKQDRDLKIRHVFKNSNGKYFYDYSELI